jgi:hypothetical protein
VFGRGSVGGGARLPLGWVGTGVTARRGWRRCAQPSKMDCPEHTRGRARRFSVGARPFGQRAGSCCGDDDCGEKARRCVCDDRSQASGVCVSAVHVARGSYESAIVCVCGGIGSKLAQGLGVALTRVVARAQQIVRTKAESQRIVATRPLCRVQYPVPYSSRLQGIHRPGSVNCDRSRLRQCYRRSWRPRAGRRLSFRHGF